MHIANRWIIPEIVYSGDFVDSNVEKSNNDFNGLKTVWEKALQNACFSISNFYGCISEEYRKQNIEYHNREFKELWKPRADHDRNVRKEIMSVRNVAHEHDLPEDAEKEVLKLSSRFLLDNGIPPRAGRNHPMFFYAENFVLAIDKLVLALKKLSECKDIFKDYALFETQIKELSDITGSKDMRDSIIHNEDRVRGKNKFGKDFVGEASDEFDMFTSDSVIPSVMHFGNLMGNKLVYTNFKGEHCTMEISIDFFKEVEERVQLIFDNIKFKGHPSMLAV